MTDNVIQFPRPVGVAAEPTARDFRRRVLDVVSGCRAEGATWKEVQTILGNEHGSISASLSTMHKAELLDRLSEERENCKVYVLPEWVQDRETERPSKSATVGLLDDMAAVLREVPTRCKHRFSHPNCRSCEIRLVLHRYNQR